MTWKRNVLVVANVTAASDELVNALKTMSAAGPTEFTLIVPATSVGGGHPAAQSTLAAALARLERAGLEARGEVGCVDPFEAVAEVWDPKRHDDIVVSTLPLGSSRWMHAGLPERIGKLTGAPVTHVVSRPARPAHLTEAAPAPATHSGMLTPFEAIGYARR
jgi:hypothetical protein